MDVHILLSPNPVKSNAKIQLDDGQYQIQSQEYAYALIGRLQRDSNNRKIKSLHIKFMCR